MSQHYLSRNLFYMTRLKYSTKLRFVPQHHTQGNTDFDFYIFDGTLAVKKKRFEMRPIRIGYLVDKVVQGEVSFSILFFSHVPLNIGAWDSVLVKALRC